MKPIKQKLRRLLGLATSPFGLVTILVIVAIIITWINRGLF
jgi:hypothetical protein